MTHGRAIDPAKVKVSGERIFSYLKGMGVSAMIYLGDTLGLYRAMMNAGPLTSDELAQKTGLHERWVREWLRGQAAAGILDYAGDGRFELSVETGMFLADPESPKLAVGIFSDLPQRMAVVQRLPESFRTGIGLNYDARGPEGAVGIERVFGNWYRFTLVQKVLPELEGVTDKLRAGAKAADIGCGAGMALLEMAKAFPHSQFHGYDISKHALTRAEANKAAAGVKNVTFHDVAVDRLPGDSSFDFITTFDCIHDMTHPMDMIQAIRKAIKPNGTWFIADPKSAPTFEENLARNPMTALMYAFSVMGCMSSALSEPGGAGLGTLGFNEEVARRMTAEAGFTRFTRHDFENPLNAYYEVRP
ncbi:MAG: methyltransferase domain-containing protein [Candidatus Binatia bacterium]